MKRSCRPLVLVLLQASTLHAAPDPPQAAAQEGSEQLEPPWTHVEMVSAGVDLGMPTGSAESEDHSAGTLGITGELMFGNRYVTGGGFLRWGIGGLPYGGPMTDNGLFRSGPRLRLMTALKPPRPSLFVAVSPGWGLAYAREFRETSDPLDADGRELARSETFWQLFVAPGAGVLIPTGPGPRTWHVALGVNYYFTYWLQRSARDLPLADQWVEFSVLIGHLRVPGS